MSIKPGQPISFFKKLFVSLSGNAVTHRAHQNPQGAFPLQAGFKSQKVELQKGKEYLWCACGMSKNQPFCDGSHFKNGSHYKPLRFVYDGETDEDKDTKVRGLC